MRDWRRQGKMLEKQWTQKEVLNEETNEKELVNDKQIPYTNPFKIEGHRLFDSKGKDLKKNHKQYLRTYGVKFDPKVINNEVTEKNKVLVA